MEETYGKVYRAREKATGKIVALKKTRLHEVEERVPPPLSERYRCCVFSPKIPMSSGQKKEGKTVLCLVFEYMDNDLKKYIRGFRQTRDHIPPATVKRKSGVDRRNIVGYGGDEAAGTLAMCVEEGGGRRRRRSRFSCC